MSSRVPHCQDCQYFKLGVIRGAYCNHSSCIFLCRIPLNIRTSPKSCPLRPPSKH